MELTFYCEKCDKKFTSEGVKKEYQDYTFGPCMKYVARCPDCNGEASEYRNPKPQKTEISSNMPSCSDGSCCCMN